METRIRTEFEINCLHKPGELARLMAILYKAGVNVLAFCGYAVGKKGNIYFVPDDETRTAAALKQARIKFTMAEVVAVRSPAGPGDGAKFTQALAKSKVNLLFTYASTTGTGESTVILGVKDPERVAKVLGETA